jgi:hypothetical protein
MENSMSESEHLHAQALHCRRIAAQTGDDPGLAEDLRHLADDYDKRASLSAKRHRQDRDRH